MAETKHHALPKRRWNRFLVGALGVSLLLTLVYPLWLPWVIKPVASGFGVQFEDYERHGYAAFEFSNVKWTSRSASISAERFRFHAPHRFLWARFTGAAVTDPQVRVQGWSVEIIAAEPSTSGGTGSTAELLDQLQSTAPSLSQWVHSIVLTTGAVKLSGNSYAIPAATLQDGRFTLQAFESRADVDLSSLQSSSLSILVSNELAAAEIELKGGEGNWTFVGGVHWQANHVELKGEFDQSSWLPVSATLGSESLVLPSALSGVDEFPDLQGSVQTTWSDGGYTFAVNLTNQLAVVSSSQFDGISLQAIGRGNFRALELNRFKLAAPFLKATLDKPLTFDFAGTVEGRNTTLNLWADLSQVEAIDAEGQLSGVLTVRPTLRSPLRLSFSLHGAHIAGAGLQTKSVAMAGVLDWPHLQMTNLTAEFDSGGRLVADVQLDLGQMKTKVRTAQSGRDGATGGAPLGGWRVLKSHWQFDGLPPVALPESVKFKNLHASGSVEGVWPELSHTGSATLSGIEAGPFRAATGRASWSGRHLSMERLSVRFVNGSSTVDLEGKGGAVFHAAGGNAHLALDAFDLVTRRGEWRLQSPVRVEMVHATNTFVVEVSPLELVGPDHRLAMEALVHWPSNGSGRISIQGLSSADLDEFLAPNLPALTVPDAILVFGWNNGPVTFDIKAQAEWREGDDTVWSLECTARSDGDMMQFDSTRVDLNGTPAVMLSGHLPLRLEPGAGWRIRESPENQTAQLDLSVIEQGPLWAILEEYAGVRTESPTLTFQARGDVPNVEGRLSFNAANVALTQTNTSPLLTIPQLDKPRFEARVGLGRLEILGASAQLLGQPIEAEAYWEVAASDWNEWIETIVTHDLERLTGWVRMENAKLSALAALSPDIIAPIGNLDLDLSLKPGLQVEGHLTLTNGATRYLKPLGALRDIEADITLSGREASINTFSATLGGRPLTVDGDLGWRADGDYRVDLHLVGENLSLVREPELFMRADVDVRLQKLFEEVARLYGDVNLQHSLLFQDFTMFVGGDRERPDQRPPYFSVPQPPFGDWQLDVRVKGDRFLNVISPAFKGEVSAGLQLLGTLREPMAVGAVSIDQGKILFPFGTLQIESGRVELRREDPYRPRLDFRGQGENFGFAITVDLQGPMDAPNLTFQSVPPLTAQQILMMLSAGEIPRSDFGYNTTDKASKVGLYVGKELVNRFIGNTSTTERLSVRSGEQITDDGKPTYSIEYHLTDRWSVFGEYNRFQDVNSGLKFKVLSK